MTNYGPLAVLHRASKIIQNHPVTSFCHEWVLIEYKFAFLKEKFNDTATQ